MHVGKEDIEDLKERTDILELVRSAGVALRPQGRTFVGLCPFIPEKSPSFTVNPEARLFNCFGACKADAIGKTGADGKAGGDCITFVMKWKKLSFQEAYLFLGGRTPSGTAAAPRAREATAAPICWVRTSSSSEASQASAADREATPAAAPFELGRAPRTRLLVAAVDRWISELSHDLAAQEYLESRGLVTKAYWRLVKMGYSSGSLSELCGTQASEARKHYIEMGILIESESGSVTEAMKGRIVVPFVALNQLPVGVYGRSVRDELLPHHRLLRGPRSGNINGNAARGYKELHLVESAFDAVSMMELGFLNTIPFCGAELLPDHLELLRRHDVKSVVVGLDSDDTGRKSAPAVAEALRQAGIAARLVEWPEKDPNELLVRHGAKEGREIVEALLRAPKACDLLASSVSARPTVDGVSISPLLTAAAAPEAAVAPITNGDAASVREGMSGAEAEGAEAQSADAAEASGSCAAVSDPAPLADVATLAASPAAAAPAAAAAVAASLSIPALTREELIADELAVRFEERWWDLTWLESPSPAQLRARIHLELRRPASLPEDAALLSFLDTLNLVASRARDHFARRALSLLPSGSGLSREALNVSLESDLLRLAEIGERRRKAMAEAPDVKPRMTEERRQKALAYLRTPQLLGRLSSDIETVGYVGEESIKVLGYLVAVSRKLPEALSMVILSSSGSGKSALAEALEKLTPEEDLLVVTRFTTSSLYWMGKDAVKRKFVSIEERAGSQEADYAIRALQSKRKLSMMAPVKDLSTGKLETKLFSVEGPASFLESTTESRINHENATRCYEARLDESPEQTRRIQEAQRRARTAQGRKQKARAEELAVLHHDVQRCLRMVRVEIPFASEIEFPSVWTRNRRDQPRFLNLIEALAFLHQYQRPVMWSEGSGGEEGGAPCERALEELSDEELEGVTIEATLDDYAAAVDLAGDLLEETLVELKKPLREFLDAFIALTEEKRRAGRGAGRTLKMPGVRGGDAEPLEILEREPPALLARELRQRTRLQQHTVKRYLRELEELEYIAITRGVRGAAAAYRLVEMDDEKTEKAKHGVRGLLSVEELQRKLRGSGGRAKPSPPASSAA